MEEEFSSEYNTSIYAEEGTLAHEFADLELRIQSHVGMDIQKKKWIDEKRLLKAHPLYMPEMAEYVDVYVNYVLEEYREAWSKTPDTVLKIEEKTDFSYLVPEGFGTSDANIIADGVLEIVDFKYGKGVKVDAENNAQLRLYALGLLRKFELVYDIQTVKMVIVQPRLYHIDSEILSVEHLTLWAKDIVIPAAEKAFDGEGDCNPGDWCRWCKAKPVCRALADFNTKLAIKDFADPKTLSDSELIEVYEQSGLLVEWANAVNAYVLKEALEGKDWQGYKLVEGRANRKWEDETKVIIELCKLGFVEENYINKKIKGIGAIEKLVGKDEFSDLDLTIRPQGKPTLVPESDKRPAMGIEQAKKDFQ